MEEDVSKRTVTVLVILTVIISVLGTLSVITSMNQYKTERQIVQVPETDGSGYVSLKILPRETEAVGGAAASTGKVSLEILPKKTLTKTLGS